MVTHAHITPDVEPTPEFDAQCMAFVRGWQQGDIPASDVVSNLKDLALEAARMSHIANEARAQHLSGYIQHYIGNLNISMMHYKKARRLFDRVGNRRRVIVMDINQGENHRYRGEFKRARRLYSHAYDAALSIANIRLQTIAITNEGLMLISLGEYERAEQALNQGLVLSSQWENTDNLNALLTEIYFGLAQIALVEQDHRLAWEHAQISLYHGRVGENMHSMGLAYRILGDVLTVLGDAPQDADFESVDEYYRAALQTFSEIDAEAEIGRTIFSHAHSYANRKRRRHAARMYHEAMVIFTRLGMTDDAATAAEAQLAVM